MLFLEPLHDGGGNQVARVFLLQHHDQPAQRIIEQRLVAPVVGERPQHRGQGARQIHPPDEGARCLADEPLHLRILHGIQGGTEQPRRLLAQQTSVACIAQPLGQPQGRVVTPQQRHQRRRVEKPVAHKGGQVHANAIFVAGNDGRVRYGQPQRASKQRHHGKPVCQGAHHGGLGHGFHTVEQQAAFDQAGADEHRGHQQ